jgi:hypothetical protein
MCDSDRNRGEEEYRKKMIHSKRNEDFGASVTQELWIGEERKTNPNFKFVYHIMNNTCIYLRIK